MQKLSSWKYFILQVVLLFFFLISISPHYLNTLINMNNWLPNIFLLISIWKSLSIVPSTWLILSCTYILKFFTNSFIIFEAYTYAKRLIFTLWLGTINIHPILFYFCLGLVIAIFFSYNYYLFLLQRITLVRLLQLLTVTLSLGGVWGLQSLTWGYVWVGDKIEWLLFFFIIFLSKKLHQTKINTYSKVSGLFLTLFLTDLILIRLNVLTTRHSFLNQYPLAYTLIILLLCLILLTNISPITYQTSTNIGVYLVCCFYFFLLRFDFNCVGALKYFSLFFSLFFFFKFSTFTRRNFLFHYILILFSFVWSQTFFYFQLTFYTISFNVKHSLLVYKKGLFLIEPAIQYINGIKQHLEYVNFYFLDKFTNYFMFNSLFSYQLSFTNFTIIYILLLTLLFKDLEPRLLYKKKTYF